MAQQDKSIGIVGLGSMGLELWRSFAYIGAGQVKVTAVVEPSTRNFDKACSELDAAVHRCNNVEQMLARTDLDGIVIAAPNHVHFEILSELRGREIPVLLEKPLDSTYPRICDVVRFSESYRGPIMVDHPVRHAPIISKAKQVIDAGEIGRICSFNFVQNCHYGNAMYRTFRRTMAGGGGMFIEKATHDFDILLSLIEAKPQRVASIAKRQAFGGEKANDLTCDTCGERLQCRESVTNISNNYGLAEPMEAQGLNGCVFAQEVDVPDNEICLIECERDILGTYTERYFTPSAYPSREYELVGLEGVMRISLTHEGNDNKGRIVVCKRYGTPADQFTFDFDYRDRIHYNGGMNVARHFYHIMSGTDAPITTVRQAFFAESLGYAATVAAQKRDFIEVADLIPDDLHSIWNDNWEKTYKVYS